MLRSHFSAVFIGKFDPTSGKMAVLCVKDQRFPEFKMPGGMAEERESPVQTMRREAREEAGVDVLSGKPVLKVADPKRGHTQHFFLAGEVTGWPDPTTLPKKIVPKQKTGERVDDLTLHCLPIDQFAKNLYRGQHNAFRKILDELAHDPKIGPGFCGTYYHLLDQWGIR